MNISVFGADYVGLVSAACLVEMGNQVVCVDVDPERVRQLQAGKVPIFEPDLEHYLASNRQTGRESFTTDPEEGVEEFSNPELLKEGAAVADFMRPDGIIFGGSRGAGSQILEAPSLSSINRLEEAGALEGADALVIMTEWNAFRSPDWHRLRNSLADGVLVDGRNLYDLDQPARHGLVYYAIGRAVPKAARPYRYNVSDMTAAEPAKEMVI